MKFSFLMLMFIISCSGQGTFATNVASIDLEEASALEYLPHTGLYWTIEDSGNKSRVYGIDAEGTVKAEINVDRDNKDWESLASDKEGNLYIGDFGNNNNSRKDLCIYKVNANEVKDGKAKVSAVTKFRYPEQKKFPPSKKSRYFDCEAFIEYKGNFYLFTKNRSSNSDGSFFVYKIPNREGTFDAQIIGNLTTSAKRPRQITGADISADGSKIVLLTGDTLYLLTNFNEDNFNNVKIETLHLNHSSQKEGICFKDDDTLLIVDEENKNGKGNIYEVTLQGLKNQN